MKRFLRALRWLLLPPLVVVGVFVFLVAQPWVSPIKVAPVAGAPVAGTPIPGSPAAVDQDALRRHVYKLAVELQPRNFTQRGNLGRAAEYIEEGFRASGAAVTRQSFMADGEPFQNVIAHFGPQTGPLLVIGAHYDGHEDTPGADDNASGVAGLLELSRLLGKYPPAHPVELVAYTLEEPPFFRTGDMGSAHHAAALKAKGRAVRLMISLEMIGYFSDVPGSQSYPLPGLGLIYPERGNYIALVGRFGDFGLMRQVKGLMQGAGDLAVYSINAPPMVPGIDFSDHLNYWYESYPALMVTDTAFNRNHEYHRAGDTFDRLDYARMAQVVQAVHAVAQGLDQGGGKHE